jgi:redox-sensitive bicupin YhaK (pirin superfamily)
VSGPLLVTDAQPDAEKGKPTPPCVEVSDDKEATVGRMQVRRALPRRGRRTVGPWCFADHMGPADVTERRGLDIGPHPHLGLQTVTWLMEGSVLHRDSLGSEQVIEPGELNLMTAGFGVAHSEEATGAYSGTLHGVQLWVAQPSGTRNGSAAFEHHRDLPRLDLGAAEVIVLLGDVDGAHSPARYDSPLVGADLTVQRGDVALPLRPDFEHALMLLSGAVSVDDTLLSPGVLGYLGQGRDELLLRAGRPARALLIGGEPFTEPILMWWNFVARDRAELELAYHDWQRGTDRFGHFFSPLERIPAPAPFWSIGSH